MEMQDKEFDELFRAKLDSFEAVPSGMVWDNINQQLDKKPRYRKLLPYFGIAASIIVLAAASILFIPKRGVHAGHQPKNIVAKAQPHQPVITEQAQPKEQRQPTAQPVKRSENMIAHIKPHKPAPIVQQVNKKQPVELQTPARDDQPILAAASPKPDVIKPVVPDKNVPLLDKPVINDAPIIAAVAQAPAANSSTDETKPGEVRVKPKHHERGLGGLLNKLIAKVDKRKDKVIEFSYDEDEGESSITGVNLGVIRLKKDKAAK